MSLTWETFDTDLTRASIPGGWLVRTRKCVGFKKGKAVFEWGYICTRSMCGRYEP
jgi:hypothetical protein